MYKVIDNIFGEIVEFKDKYDAELEAQRRLELHTYGYDVRRSHVPGCNAILVHNPKNKTYEITVGGR